MLSLYKNKIEILYAPELKLYDFTVYNNKGKFLYHSHVENVEILNQLIQEFK